MSLINREKAIRTIMDYNEGAVTKFTAKELLEQLPEEKPETSIMTVTVKPDELVGFAKWVLDEIWDEELWEYNWQGFPELGCRKLLKRGFIKTNEEGNYERNE